MNKFVIIQMIGAIFLSSFQGMNTNHSTTSQDVNTGVDITYEVTVTAPPEAGIVIKATYSNISSPLKLQISYDTWSEPTLDQLKGLQFSSQSGADLSERKLNNKTVEVLTNGNSIIANYAIDLAQSNQRGTKISTIGGAISGIEALVPSNQTINSVKVKFSLPEPWVAISPYPSDGDWFVVKPYTYEDLSLETKASGWYFGNVDFDQTKTYPDGFEIRVVGFKYFDYEHWDVYKGDTPLEEVIKTADFYHATYLKLKETYGEFPLPYLLLVGPAYWQAGMSMLRQQTVGWYRYEYIPHHLIHSYFGQEGSRISYSGRFYTLLREGYTTYSEGIMSAEISGDLFWRGMLFERKFHYLRGIKFNHLTEEFHSHYVLGFIVTYLMDQEIKKETDGKKGIDDLMVSLWQKYNTPNFIRISDDQVLNMLKELTGNDWQWFYNQNVVNTGNLDVTVLDDLKGDFDEFLKVVSDQWYNGYPSMYFVGQEIVAAAGDFDFNVRLQDPTNVSPNIGDFSLAALKYMDGTQSDLTEDDVEAILHQVTGKDHSDFFEFYRSQGFEIDPNEITEAVKTFTFKMWGMDNAVKLTPNIFPLGQSTSVVGELVDPDFANAKNLLLQVQVFYSPACRTDIRDLITGKEVSYQFAQEFSDGGNYGAGSNYIFSLPIIKNGDKTYTEFTINLPKEDAGVILYSFWAKNGQGTEESWLGGFIGTKKVSFKSMSTFIVKPISLNMDDSEGDTKPFLKIVSDDRYNGYPSMSFIEQELVPAASELCLPVSTNGSPNIGNFAIAALKYMDTTQSDLTEYDIEEILHQVTGLDHSEFFEFYRNQGFEIDPKEITEAVKTFTYIYGDMDNAVKLTPNIFPLGQSTSVVGELVDPDFANSNELLLQVQVFAPPTGLTNTMDLITGKKVSYQFAHEFSDGGTYGAGSNYIFSLPKIKIGDKTYTFFTVNLPEEDAGVILYSFLAKNGQATSDQSMSTFIVKPTDFNLIDVSPPLLSITQPAEYEIATPATSFCVRGLVEPEASVELNGIKATISTNLFKFNGCVDLLPGRNLIEVKASDNSGNITTREIIVNSPDVATPTSQITATNPVITTESPQRPSLSTWKLVILLMIIILVVGIGYILIKRQTNE